MDRWLFYSVSENVQSPDVVSRQRLRLSGLDIV